MPKRAAHLALIARIHAGDKAPETKITLRAGGPDNADHSMPFLLSTDMTNFGRLNKKEGVFVEHDAGKLPTLEQRLATVQTELKNELPAKFEVEPKDSLPVHDDGSADIHYWNGERWIKLNGADAFSAGFRIVLSEDGTPVKSLANIGGVSIWMDFLVVIQSVQ